MMAPAGAPIAMAPAGAPLAMPLAIAADPAGASSHVQLDEPPSVAANVGDNSQVEAPSSDS